jgi:hypothetical protein
LADGCWVALGKYLNYLKINMLPFGFSASSGPAAAFIAHDLQGLDREAPVLIALEMSSRSIAL